MTQHAGHRKRMRDRFLQYGLDNFDEHNVLELLLFYAVPRMDTNELAHSLIERFGSLDGVLEAPMEELVAVRGMGESAAALLKLVPAVARRYMISKASKGEILSTSEAAGRYMTPYFFGALEERVYIACLDAKFKVICVQEMGVGAVNSASVSVRKIVETALSRSASAVILAHNHTSGIALPSLEDELTTTRLRDALDLVGIALTDHIIVAGDDYVSLADSGVMRR